MRTPEELRALLDALPRPIGLSSIVSIGTIDPKTGQYTNGLDDYCYAEMGNIDEALLLLEYMQAENS